MKKNINWIPVILVILIIGSLSVALFRQASITRNQKKVENVVYKEIIFESIEIASTSAEIEKGLMYRQELCATCGMLFVFNNSANRIFWMQNTYLALDMIFMDEDGKVINIQKNTTPLDSIKRYPSDGPAKYTLEVNAGFSDQVGLKAGDRLNVDDIIKNGAQFSGTPTPNQLPSGKSSNLVTVL